MELRIMKNSLSNRLEAQNRFVAKCLIKGMTISQIAQRLDCSTSTVSNRIKKILAKYNAKSRGEFILNVLAEIIKKDREKLEIKDDKLNKYYQIFSQLNELKENKDKLQAYVSRLTKFL